MKTILSFLLRLLVLALCLVVFLLMVSVFLLWQVHDLDPQGWNEGVVEFFGREALLGFAQYQLSAAEAKVAQDIGLDSQLVARASLAEFWADEQWGRESGDRALYIALTQGESGDCRNAGTGFAVSEIRKRFDAETAAKQIEALTKLLEVWQRNDIRANPGSYAADYLTTDYGLETVKGSAGAGALGCSQFLPGTAIQHLMTIGEPFDLWNPQTSMLVMAAELHRLDWSKDADLLTKVDVLAGWNQNRLWGTGIITQAEAYRGYLGVRSGLTQAGILEEPVWWKSLAAFGLQAVGLLPDETTLRHQVLTSAEGIFSWQKDLLVAGGWQIPIANPTFVRGCAPHQTTGETCGWDLGVDLGTPIFPAKAGQVTEAQCGWNDGYGCFVRVDHGAGAETRYAHLAEGSLAVKVGDEVGKETLLGRVGLTGKTSGPHLHFETILDGLAVDPDTVMGSFGDIIEANQERRER